MSNRKAQSGEKVKKMPRGRPFEKGNPGGPGCKGGKPKGGFGSMLAEDMKQAYSQPAKPGDPPGVRHARALLTTDYPKFVTMYAKLVGGAGGVDQLSSGGEGEERARDIVSDLFDQFQSELSEYRQWRASRGGANAVEADKAQEGATAAQGQ